MISKSLIGFENINSTCYMNSGLQILLHIKTFVEKLFYQEINSNKTITNNIIELCKNILEIQNRNLEPNIKAELYFKPLKFRNIFIKEHPNFSNEQQDVVEFLRILIDDLSKENNKNKNKSFYKEFKTTGKEKDIMSYEFHKTYIKRENSFINEIFINQLINEFKCECGYITFSFEKIFDIPLIIPSNNNYNLIDLLDYNFKDNVVFNDKCINCKKKFINHIKQIKFDILNDIQ